MLVLTHLVAPGMTLAPLSTPLNNRLEIPVRYAEPLNGMPDTALFEEFVACCHARNYSVRTREVYWGWIKRFILFHRKRDPAVMGAVELEQFMASLDVQGRVIGSSRNQAFSALLFLYRDVLHLDIGDLKNAVRSNLPKPSSDELSMNEVNHVLSGMHGAHWLATRLLFDTDMQLMECLRLRVRDISLAKNEILVRDSRDELVIRIVVPTHLHQPLKAQLQRVLEDHAEDMKGGWQGVYLPEPLQLDYRNVSKSLAWQYVFAAKRLPHDPCDGMIRRYHLDEREIQRAFAHAAQKAGIEKSLARSALCTVMTERMSYGQK